MCMWCAVIRKGNLFCKCMGFCEQVSGTTATVAAISGWEAVIANVGDSCAYMDTGVEVVLVSFLYS